MHWTPAGVRQTRAEGRHVSVVNPDSSHHHWRAPVAWTAIAVGGGYLLDGVLQVARVASQRGGTLSRAALAVGGYSLPLWVLLAMAAAALACAVVVPAVASAGRILRAAAAIAGLGALLELVLLAMGLFSPVLDGFAVLLDVLGGVLSITLKALVCWVLWRVARDRAPGAVAVTASTEDVTGGAVPGIVSPEGSRATGQPAGVAPAWSPDEAMGTVWTRAGDAATGAAGHQEATSSDWQVRRPASRSQAAGQIAGESTAATGDGTAWRGGWATAGELASGQQPKPAGTDADPMQPRSTPVWRAAGEGDTDRA